MASVESKAEEPSVKIELQSEVVQRKPSTPKEESEETLLENSAKKEKKSFKEKVDDFVAQFYNSEYREFLSKDAMGWLKLSAFYSVFYFWLACFFCTMLFIFWAVRIRGQNLPIYYNEESVMNYKVVNPGLGFRPHLEPESELIHVKVGDADELVRSQELFLKEYEEKKENEFVGAHDEKVNYNIDEVLKGSPCSKENKYGVDSASPCVAVKLNRIIGWKPQPVKISKLPAGLNETVKTLKENDKLTGQEYVYVTCSGQNGADRDNIKTVEYYSSHFSNMVGGINFKYFPYMNQPDYLSPLVFVHFKEVSSNTLINVICKAYADNIDNEDRLNQRGMTKFRLFVEDSSKKVTQEPLSKSDSSESKVTNQTA